MARILIIDDEEALLRSVELSLTRSGHTCLTAATGRTGVQAFEAGADLVLLDLHLPDINGLEVLERIRQRDGAVPVVVITAFASVKGAVAAITSGALDYIEKPIDLEKLLIVVERALETSRLRGRVAGYERAQRSAAPVDLIGRDAAMARAREMAERVSAPGVSAARDLPTVMLLGETGTGKGLFARFIHDHSPCADKPFVQVNCAAVPPTLFESELFGHERGAFTDARTERTGLLEAANEGTLFLDEIGEMPIELQSKLAVALEKKTFRRVGGTRERRMDARIIAATNVNLLEAIREGRFRQDLYYRLNVFAIELPPLRRRGRDVVDLAEHFIAAFARKYRKPPLVLTEAARAALLGYPWPGNVRELIHVLERAVLLSHADVIGPLDLNLNPQAAAITPMSAQSAAPSPPACAARLNGHLDLTDPAVTLDAVERALIEEALRHSRGNISHAARLLGIGRGSLRRKLERHRITMYVDFGSAGEESRA